MKIEIVTQFEKKANKIFKIHLYSNIGELSTFDMRVIVK